MQTLTLTPDQQHAKQAILHFLSTAHKCFVLTGHAGTGKTTLIQNIAAEHQAQAYPNKTWRYCATTHKAAEALAQATGEDTSTIHALLDIRVRSNFETGEQYLYRSKQAERQHDLIIVIDECSYIDQKLLRLIHQATDNSCKLIFMGDPNQLTPVGSDEVPVFQQHYATAQLQQVVRQAKDNPIQDICRDFRKTIQQHCGFPKISLSKHILHLSKAEFEQQMTQDFSRNNWQQGDSKVLAWRNKTVQAYNQTIFQHVKQRNDFQTGDYILNNHYVDGLKADHEYQIESLEPTEQLNVIGHYIKLSGVKNHYFVPLHNQDYHQAKKQALKQQDSAAVKTIMQTWADLRPAYACTVNKSQGSTYQKVFIDLDDLAKCKDALQLARLLYVASSRARQQVIYTGDLT